MQVSKSFSRCKAFPGIWPFTLSCSAFISEACSYCDKFSSVWYVYSQTSAGNLGHYFLLRRNSSCKTQIKQDLQENYKDMKMIVVLLVILWKVRGFFLPVNIWIPLDYRYLGKHYCVLLWGHVSIVCSVGLYWLWVFPSLRKSWFLNWSFSIVPWKDFLFLAMVWDMCSFSN